MTTLLINILEKNKHQFSPVVPFEEGKDKLVKMDFTGTNKDLSQAIIEDIQQYSSYIEKYLKNADAKFGIGGYAEQ